MATTKSTLRSKKSRREKTARRIHNLLNEHQDVIEEIGKPEEVFAKGGIQYKFIEGEGLYVVEYKMFKSNKKYYPGFVKVIYSEKSVLPAAPLRVIRYDLLNEEKKLIHELSPEEAEKWTHDGQIRKPQSMTEPTTIEWFELRVKPSKLGTKEIPNGLGGKDILYITYEGRNIAQFRYNTHGYQENFLLRNKENRRMNFGEKSKMHQLAAFKKALKSGYTEIKDYTKMPEGKDDFAKGGSTRKIIKDSVVSYKNNKDWTYQVDEIDEKDGTVKLRAIERENPKHQHTAKVDEIEIHVYGHAKGGITLSKIGDKVKEFVSKANEKVTYAVHKYGKKFVVVLHKTGEAIKDTGAAIYDSFGEAVTYAKDKAEQVFEAGGNVLEGQQLVESPGSTENLQSLVYKKGGKPEDYWIDDAITHPGKLRRHAIKEGLIKKDEKLSEADLHKLEQEGGTTAKEAHLAETLASFHEKGGIIYQDKKLYRVKLADGKYVQFEGFDMYYDLRNAKDKERLFEAEGGKMEEAFPKYGITEAGDESSNTPFMYFESKEDIKKFHKNPEMKIKIWKLKYKDEKYGWGGSPLSSGDVTQPVYADGGKTKGGLIRVFSIESKQWYNTPEHKYTDVFFGYEDEHGEPAGYITIDWEKVDDKLWPGITIGEDSWGIAGDFADVYKKLAQVNDAHKKERNYDEFITEAQVVEVLKECGFKDATKYERKEGGGFAMPQRAAAGTVAMGIAGAHEIPQLADGAALTERKPARIPNAEANIFTENRVDFTGNNMEGRMMPNGDYQVVAFGVYPLWLWCAKDKSWYGNEDKPNMAVSRMFSESRPDWDAKLIPHGEIIKKSLEYAERYDLGGLMVKQLYPMSTDNTGIAHSGETNTTI